MGMVEQTVAVELTFHWRDQHSRHGEMSSLIPAIKTLRILGENNEDGSLGVHLSTSIRNPEGWTQHGVSGEWILFFFFSPVENVVVKSLKKRSLNGSKNNLKYSIPGRVRVNSGRLSNGFHGDVHKGASAVSNHLVKMSDPVFLPSLCLGSRAITSSQKAIWTISPLSVFGPRSKRIRISRFQSLSYSWHQYRDHRLYRRGHGSHRRLEFW